MKLHNVGSPLREKLFLWRENLIVAIAWRLPRSVAYWCAIRVGAHATTGQYKTQDVTTLTHLETLKRWDSDSSLAGIKYAVSKFEA